MPNEDDRTKPAGQVQQAGAPSVGSVGDIGQIEGQPQNPPPGDKAESPADKAARRTATATVWIAAFTVVLALVGGITLYVVIDGGSDTKAIAEAAKRQSSAAAAQVSNMAALAIQTKNQADQMKIFADRMKEQAAETRAIAEQAIVQAKASEVTATNAQEALAQQRRQLEAGDRQSKAALDASVESSQNEQRAWVGISKVGLMFPYTSRNMGFTAEMMNSGKVPAFVDFTDVAISSSDSPFAQETKLFTNHDGEFVIAPGLTLPMIMKFPTAITEAAFADLTSRKKHLQFRGSIHYHDIFGGNRLTEICLVMTGTQSDMIGPNGVGVIPVCKGNGSLVMK